MRSRATAARVARLATINPDGQPHLVPCCFALDDDTVYTPVDDVKAKSTHNLQRLDNIAAHPDVAILIDHYTEDWSALWWLRLDGVARAFHPESPQHNTGSRLLAAKYQQYTAASPHSAMIAIDITRWSAWP